MTTNLALAFLLSYALIAGVDKLASFSNAFSLPGAHGSSLGSPGIVSGPGSSNLPFSLDGSHHTTSQQKRSLNRLYRRKRSNVEFNDYDEDDALPSTRSGLGVIGCKFSKELCEVKSEWCFDDYAFGRCLNIYEPPEPSQLYRYQLTKADSHGLEKEMERLYSLGYRWSHVYTQCVLQSLLDAIRLGTKWDTSLCSAAVDQDLEGAMKAFEDETDPTGLAYVRFKPSDSNPHPDFADELYQPPILQSLAPASPVVLDDGPFSLSFMETWGGKGEPKKPSLKSILKEIPQREASAAKSAQEEELEEALNEYLSRAEQERFIQKKSSYVPRGDEEQLLEGNIRWMDNPAYANNIEDPESLAFLQALADSAASNELWNDLPVSDPVNTRRIIAGEKRQSPMQPKIFSPMYNTPSLFRRGIETKDDLDQDETLFLENPVQESEIQPMPETLPIPMALQEEILGLDDENQEDSGFQQFLDGPEQPRQEPTSRKPLYTEGGIVYLNNPKRQLFYDFDPNPNSESRRGTGFERQERLDVKKPGPWYKSVNNYAFDYDHKHSNPEFQADEGPADMQLQSTFQENPQEAAQEQIRSSKVAKSVEESASAQVQEKARNVEENTAQEKKSGTNYILGLGDRFEMTDDSYVNVFVQDKLNYLSARQLVDNIAHHLEVAPKAFNKLILNVDQDMVTFHVNSNKKQLNATEVARLINKYRENITIDTGINIHAANIGLDPDGPYAALLADTDVNRYIFLVFFVLILLVSAGVGAAAIVLIRRHSKQQEKLARLGSEDPDVESCKDYQDLCRARMAAKNNDKMEPSKAVQRAIGAVSKGSEDGTSSSRSSTSSWNEEPVMTNMDISTGHMVLSYMEDHLKKKDRLEQEWAALCKYEAEPCSTAIAEKPENQKKNRYTNSLPYDHSRVILAELANVNGTDYINASTITDHDPRNPAYIATQGPLQTTAADFWQMVWEQGSVVIVALTRISDNGTNLCHRYWPEEGSELHHIYEVHLVSEHVWCDEYLVRSFYLKNLKTGETRTVTQFHFRAWPENGIPVSTKAILEFRRKVNKSYRGRSCPIIVHCSDGAGRTGTYCLIDMVLNRMAKGAKEIDIAASLEHIRDQRPGMVRTKQQFEFVLMAVAEEVHAILKALPQ